MGSFRWSPGRSPWGAGQWCQPPASQEARRLNKCLLMSDILIKVIWTSTNQGCILNFQFIFLPPPPSWIIFFPQRKFITMGGCAPFFCNFVNFKSIGENMHTFYQIGEKICIFSPFLIPFQSFFSPNMIFGHIFARGSNIKIYTPGTNKRSRGTWDHQLNLTLLY